MNERLRWAPVGVMSGGAATSTTLPYPVPYSTCVV